MHRLRKWILPSTAACCVVCGAAALSPAHSVDRDWSQWRDDQIAHILEPTFDSNGEHILDNNELARRCRGTLEALYEQVERNPQFLREHRLENLARFVTEQHWLVVPGHGLGTSLADEDFLKSVSINLPPLLAGKEFIKAVASPATYRTAVNMIQRSNEALPNDEKWIVVLFDSRFLLSADQAGYGRMLVFIPGPTDLWVNFAIATPSSQGALPARSVSVVEVGPKQSILVDYIREEGKLVPMQQVRHDPSDRCYDCHKAPANPIWPDRTYAFEGDKLVEARSNELEGLNRRIQGYGVHAQAGVDREAYGPSLGPADKVRSAAFIRFAAGSRLSEESVHRVRAAMNCTSCHDSFAPLNFPSGIKTTRDLNALKLRQPMAQTYVESGKMPPGNKLTPEERQALWRCLSREYYDPEAQSGLLVDWLRER